MVIRKKQRKVLEKALSQGWLTQDEIIGIYSTQSSASRGLSRLVDSGLLEKQAAPPNSEKRYVYYPTDLCRDLLGYDDS